VRARLHGPAELVAAVPYLIGFHPRDSLVLLGAQTGDLGIAVTLRLDLADVGSALARREVAAMLAAQGCAAAFVVVVGGGRAGRSGPPRRRMVAALRDACDAAGISTRAAVWAARTARGAPWACYGACRCAGELPDPACSTVAAATVAAGQVVYADRAELERLVAPGDRAALRRRSALLERLLDRAADGAPVTGRAECAVLLERWVAASASAVPEPTDDDVARLALALADPLVRDAAMGYALGRHAAAAERLWLALVTRLPDPEAAEPAVLLAHCALMRSDGALAGAALRRAQRAWPGHRLSALFQEALARGIGPDELRTWFAEGHRQAAAMIAEGGPA
jgi:hypothetical protein